MCVTVERMSSNARSALSGLTEYVSAAMPTWSSPGVALAVVKGSEVLYQGVFGQRDVVADLPLTADTRFPMASVTKAVAAMSLALLVDEGKLSGDTPRREYMPEFVLKDAYATQHVTARDMLSHRTGLPRHDLSAWRLDLPPAEFVKRLRTWSPAPASARSSSTTTACTTAWRTWFTRSPASSGSSSCTGASSRPWA